MARITATDTQIIVRPAEYERALRNPLGGFRPALGRDHAWGTLVKHYIRWNEIENAASDGVERIAAFCDARWRDIPARNIKIIPRVYLHWPGQGKYWPADLREDDYESAAFRRRVVRLIERLGRAWNGDGRVAFIEMGLIGKWGEQHSPEPSAEMQRILGDAFTAHFPNKLVMNRYPRHFENYRFGIYWDSFGHPNDVGGMLPALQSDRLADRWKIAPMGGEMAFDWGTPLGKDPTDAVLHHSDAIIALARRLHWNHLGWVSDYDEKNPQAAANAERIQRALGWRFVLDAIRCPRRVEPGKPFAVSFVVRNTGASPFYYRWPVELALLDPRTRRPVWTTTFRTADVRAWLPGGGPGNDAPKPFTIRETFVLPRSVDRGSYLLSLALLDPVGNRPCARFAIVNCFHGGRHPLARIGVGTDSGNLEPGAFDDPATDTSLRYGG